MPDIENGVTVELLAKIPYLSRILQELLYNDLNLRFIHTYQ